MIFTPLRRLGRLALPFIGLQGIIYMLTVAAGIVMVRLLPPREYAVFTVAFAAFTVQNIIADGGVGSAMTALGARHRGDPAALRTILSTVYGQRVRLAVLASLVAGPFLVFSMDRAGFSVVEMGVAAALSLVFVGLNIAFQPHLVLLRLSGAARRLQRIELVNVGVRIAVMVPLLTLVPSGLAALSLMVAVSGVMSVQVLRATRHLVGPEPAELDFGPEVRSIVRHSLPSVAFYALNGQMTVWLTALFATTLAVASVGALSRVAAVYAVLTPFVTSVAVPWFATLAPARAARAFITAVTVSVLLAASVFGAVLVVAPFLLGILGDAYRGLTAELAIFLAMSGMGFVGFVAGELLKARAWVRQSWLTIPATLGTQAVALFSIPIDTLRGALWFGVVSAVPGVIVSLYQAHIGVRSEKS